MTRVAPLRLLAEDAEDLKVIAAALQDADAALKEADFMPPVDGLPEFMPQAEFQARYGGIGAAPYRRMMAEIEQRVMSRPLLR